MRHRILQTSQSITKLLMLLLFCCWLPAALHGGEKDKKVSEKCDVLLLRPLISFIDYRTDAVLPGEQFGEDTYLAHLQDVAMEKLKGFDANVIIQEAITDKAVRDAAGLLEREISKLSRGIVDEGMKEALRVVLAGTNSDRALVMAQYMKVKVGHHNVWASKGIVEPLILKTTIKETTLLLQLALISCKTGQIVWQGQGFARDLPRVKSKKFNELMENTYRNLTTTMR
jgi:hypothetical protein